MTFSNRFPGKCWLCQRDVPAGQGQAVKVLDRWRVECSLCHKPPVHYRRSLGKKNWR